MQREWREGEKEPEGGVWVGGSIGGRGRGEKKNIMEAFWRQKLYKT